MEEEVGDNGLRAAKVIPGDSMPDYGPPDMAPDLLTGLPDMNDEPSHTFSTASGLTTSSISTIILLSFPSET